MRRRWPLGLAALLGFLLVGSMVAAVVKGARVKGSVPGKGAILGLAVTGDGFLIGTSEGLLTSADGRTWTRVDGFSGETLVAGTGRGAVLYNDGELFYADRGKFAEATAELAGASALTSTPDGTVYAARGRELVVLAPDGKRRTVEFDQGPPRILALAVGDTGSELMAGGLSTGLWRSDSGGKEWTRILETPIRAALIDRGKPGRRLIGTAGGVLWSTETRPWQFTDLRVPVESLAETPDGYFAITADRLLYESEDGLEWKVRILQQD
jgi:hypothetical protein